MAEFVFANWLFGVALLLVALLLVVGLVPWVLEPVTTTAAEIGNVNAMTGAGGQLHEAVAVLFNAGLVPGRNLTLAAVLAAAPTYTGYAPVTGITFGTAYIDPQGKTRADAPSIDWIVTGGTPSDTIYGVAILTTGSYALVQAALLSTPVPLTLAGQGISTPITYGYGD